MDIRSWKQLIRARLAGARMDDDVVEEIAEHAMELYREQRALGRSHEAAHAEVAGELTDLPALMRAARAARAVRNRRLAPAPEAPPPGRFRWVSAFGRDLAYGARFLVARPAFTLIAVLTLALGIGANTAIFSVVNALLLEPLPFPEADRLVMLWQSEHDSPGDLSIVTAPNWQDWQKASTSFSHMAIWEYRRFNLSGGPEPEQVPGVRVSSGAFPMLGIGPQLGRTFTAEEDAPGHHVVVIGDGLWRRRFDARPDVLGQPMLVNGEPHEIIGVMPASFVFPQPPQQVWVPIAFNANDARRDSQSFFAAARLADGVTFEAAGAEMREIGDRLAAEYPDANKGESVGLSLLKDLGVRPLRPTLYALLGAVAFVLLIACVNVANLLLAQAAGRQREFAIRAALGAARARLASQLLAEGLLLATAGATIGVALAWLGTAALTQALPASIRLAPFRAGGAVPIDGTVLVFTFATAILTGLVFSLAPMLGAATHHAGAALKSAGDRAGTPRFAGLRAVLVGIEVALAVVVLAGAGLMIKSLSRLVAVDPGLDARDVLVMEIALPQPDLYGPPLRTTFCEDLTREAGAIAGVRSVGAISHLPLSGANAGRGFTIEGATVTPDGGPSAFYRLTCPGYFGALGIPFVRGRDFTHSDATTAPGVVLLNEATAKEYFSGQDPIGRRLKLGPPESTQPWLTIVGVVRGVRHFGLDEEPMPEIYRPYSQAAWPQMTVTVKAAGDPLSIAAPVRAALRDIDPQQPVTALRTMEAVVEESTGQRRFPTLLLGIFSAVALLLAAIGVYGVVSYIVSQRAREIGIRMALGARASQVIGMVVRRSLGPVLVGIAAGIAASLAASRLLATLLYGVTPDDPAVLGAIAGILGATAVAACFVPARRAASVDPLLVLKEE